LLKDNYVFPDVAERIEKHIREKLATGAFDNLTNAKEFANVITKEAQSAHCAINKVTQVE
jgi:hypothetical protein